jgi:hypothetical protein
MEGLIPGPQRLTEGCVLFAASQAGPRIQELVDNAFLRKPHANTTKKMGAEGKLPTVGLHLRTGWADVLKADGGGINLECSVVYSVVYSV